MNEMTVDELIEAYKTGKLSQDDPLWLDNDTTFVYVEGVTEDEDDSVKVFEMDPTVLMWELLDYVGIPHEGV